MLEDIDVVARSYLTVFFMDINNLKDSLTGYRSIILRLEIKTSAESTKTLQGLDQDMKNAVIQWSDAIRHNVERCHIAIVSLKQTIPEINITELERLYQKIINQFTPDIEDVSKYVFTINKEFVKGTIEKMLNKMEAFYDQFTQK